jgi:MFS family permease
VIKVSYYLSLILTSVGITSVTQQTLLNAFLQVWNLLLAVTAALLVDRLGRRFLFLASTTGMLCSYIVITGLSGSYASTGSKAVGTAVIPWLFIYYGFYDIAFTPLLIAYTAEIWSYLLRARSLAVVFSVTLLAVFFNIFVNPIALGALAWKYYFVYIALLILITAIVYFGYPETRGHTLEEMARIFDGDEAAVPRHGSVLQEVRERKASIAVSVHQEVVKIGSKV